MRSVTVALLLAVALAPSAAACSLAGPVPGPGAFHVWDAEAGVVATVEVEGRTLGAMCELSNPHALEGDRFAWVEYERYASDAKGEVFLLNLTTGETERVAVAGRQHEQVSLFGDALLHWSTFTNHTDKRLVAHDLSTGASRELPLPAHRVVSARLAGGVAAFVARAGGNHEADDRLWVLDAAQQRWLVRDAPLESLGMEGGPWLRAAGEEWLLFADGRAWAYHVPENRSYALADSGAFFDRAAIEGDHVYYAEYSGGATYLMRVGLPEGEAEVVAEPAPAGFLGTVDEGRLVLGEYAVHDGWGEAAWSWLGERAGGAAVVGLGVVGLVAWRGLARDPD